jgi:translation initiation factor 2 beta subunit (eIF-2beta)/eIF-5
MTVAKPLPTTKTLIPATWDVPAEFKSRMGEKVGRQRAMQAEGQLLLVLHAPPKRDEPLRRGRLFWRKADGSWLSSDLGGGTAALAKHLGEFEDLIERFDRQEDDAAGVDELFSILENMVPIQRTARNLHATLQDARQMLANDRDLINFRDRAYEIERTSELLVSDLKNALEFAVAKKSEEQAAASHQMARQSHRLNMLAAFFFPIATLMAIFGSELRHGLQQYVPDPILFYVVLAAGLILGMALAGYLAATGRPDRPGRRGPGANP